MCCDMIIHLVSVYSRSNEMCFDLDYRLAYLGGAVHEYP